MAKIRPGDAAALAPVSRRLTPPGVFLLRMLIFLTLVGFLVAILFDQLQRSFLNNPGPQRPDRRHAASRHRLRLSPGRPALSRNPMGQCLPHFRSRADDQRQAGVACADGDDAARPDRRDIAFDTRHALVHGLDRLAARRSARYRPLSRRPARSSSVFSAPSGVCSRRSSPSVRPSIRSTARRPTTSSSSAI